MTSWTHLLGQLAAEVEERIDSVRDGLVRRFNGDPIRIAAYRGFGTAERVYVLGRVLEDAGLEPAAEGDSPVRNLVATLRRFESDEIAGARVRVRVAGTEQDVVADVEGHFTTWLTPAIPLAPAHPWHPASLELLAPLRGGHPPAGMSAQILVPPATARFGVISDLDDTVLRTDVRNILRMARSILFGNARTRVAFEGVSAFYQALHHGAGGTELNPIFYVSSSPWNLYELLVEFLELQQIPIGPLMLRDWGFDVASLGPRTHGPHKLEAITRIIDTYAGLPFLLVGDSGQEDPEIYREVVRRYPGRILAVYIRDVSPDARRDEAIAALAAEIRAADRGPTGEPVDLILTPDTLVAARHASDRGWVDPAALGTVAVVKAADEAVGAT